MTKKQRIELPVQKNQTIQIDIDDIASQGQGVGHLDGYAVFVEGALSGERVTAHIIKATRGYAVGKLCEILQPASNRVTPPCPVADKCGGCQLMHLDAAGQLAFKRRRVEQSLRRLGRLEQPVEVKATLPSPHALGYRNKAAFAAGQNAQGDLVFGFYAPRSHRLIQVQDCALQMPACGQAVRAVQAWAQQWNVRTYDEQTGAGVVRHLVVRTGAAGECIASLVVARALTREQSNALTTMLCAGVDGLCGVHVFLHDNPGNVILDGATTTLWGRSTLPEMLGNLRFEVSPRSFFQVNREQAMALYQIALDAAQIREGNCVLDAYCGTGTLTLLAAGRGAEALGVECVPEAVENAVASAERNHLSDRASFLLGEVENVLPGLLDEYRPDAVLLDPPRKGCDPRVLEQLVHRPAPRIVYVSCDPGTLARDVGSLAQAGYTIEWVQPVDMFPQTAHVETVCLLSKLHS